MALNNAKVITVTSVKGGTGTSTTVLNLAGVLSEIGKKTIIVDLDFYSGVIGASLNLTGGSDIYTLCEDFINNRFDHFSKHTFYIICNMNVNSSICYLYIFSSTNIFIK